ncbi:thiol reductant ABC exporter subunit CydD [Saccharibacillus kuerlensis]|uniref:Thiol reductant ABC exporter subunit CydD n=1 Tax=Saccharibacillus kuerlensis TaxID=459527 RepID=A0ABQ2L4N3_9BACL|nr:thiol reductant ABC exporter subunit CydD [Saccharibacillus kuerlensis]GGO03119.1 thiol reductant ABC exporter subunit CydD [Saccharibacillus kuerlensis]
MKKSKTGRGRQKSGLLPELMAAHQKRTLLIRLLSLALGAATIGQAVLLAQAVQRIFVEKAAPASLIAVFALLLGVMAVRTLLAHANGRIGLRIAADAKKELRARLLRTLAANPLITARQGQTGGKVSLALDTVDEADGYFSQYTPKMIEASIIPLLILIAVFILHVPSGLILLFTAPFIPLFMALIGIQTKHKSEEKFEQLARFSGTFLDSLQGLVTLKLFGRAKRQEREIERSSLSYRDATMDILRVAFTNTFALETIVMLGIGIVALELALQLVVFKNMQFHTAFLILLLVPEFYNLLKNMGTAFHGGRTSLGAIRNIELTLAENGIRETQTAGQSDNQSVRGNTVTGSTMMGSTVTSDVDAASDLGASRGDQTPAFAASQEDSVPEKSFPPAIELSELSFHYGSDAFTLNAGSLLIEPGQQIAIVGKSGSGKTTLLHLIAGLLPPSSGEVRIAGRALTQASEDDWFKHVTYITQHPYIFAGTVAENIAIGTDRDVSRTEIVQAAEAAGLSALAAELEHGYDTIVGDGGRGLSGGEKQRLALARAFLKRPSVLLFDEPTVGLDLHTERILMQAIAELSQQATVITIAHRLHTIRQADRILFMEQGRLIGSGSHEELLDTLPPYAQMVEIQRKGITT